MHRPESSESASTLRLVTALTVIFALEFFAMAAPPSVDDTEPVHRGYWFYLTTPDTVERPLVGICTLSWSKSGAVDGEIRFDTEDSTDPKRYSLECIVAGTNAETGKVNLTLRTVVPPKDDVPTRGAEVLKGMLTKRVQGGRITWSGKLRVIDKNALLSRLGLNGLRNLALAELPTEWDVTMIGFKHLDVSFGEAGLYQTQAEARWLPERDKEARQWLNEHQIDFETRDWKKDVWFLELPPFNQNLIVYRMLRTGIFDEVARSIVGAGPGETYSIACAQSSIFSHSPESAEGVAEELAFAQKFVADAAAVPRFRGVRFSDPVVVRTHRFRFSLVGLSSAISNGPKGYWDRNVLELAFYREFGQSDDAITLDLSIAKAERAKGPASVEPPIERFDPASESSSNILTVLGTQLGSKVKATRQGLTSEQ
jgi:hypothetical protein